jgi:hypothetical protein
MDFAVFGANQDRRFAAPADALVFGGGGGEDGGDARIDGVAARVVHAHAGFGGVVRAGGDGAACASGRKLHEAVGLGGPLRRRGRFEPDGGGDEDRK